MHTAIAASNDSTLARISALDARQMVHNEGESFPSKQWQAIAATGMFSELTDLAYDPPARVLRTMKALERLGEVCTDGGLNFSVATHLASTICAVAKFGSAHLKDQYLDQLISGELIGAHAISEHEAGSDALAMQTSAVRKGDSYVLSGFKAFVTNGPIADLIVVYAKTKPGKGPSNVSAFLVPTDTAGIKRGPGLSKTGLASSPLGTLTLSECEVPVDNLLGREGAGFAILSYVMKREILFAFIINVGEMKRRLDRCVRFANERRQFGVRIGTFQSVSNRIADMKIRYELSRKWLYYIADKLATNADVTSDIAIAKIFVSEASIASSIDAIQIHGGRGILSEGGFGEDLANSISGPIYSGTNDIQRGRIAALLGVKQ